MSAKNPKPDRRTAMCIKNAKDGWGSAWGRLSDDQRLGALCQQIVAVLLAQDEEQAPEGSPLRRLQNLALDVLSDQNIEGYSVLEARRIKEAGKADRRNPMELATEITIAPGKHTLLVAPYDGGRISGTAFLAEVTLTGSTAFIIANDRNAGKGEAYTRQADGTWLGDSGRTVVLHARVWVSSHFSLAPKPSPR